MDLIKYLYLVLVLIQGGLDLPKPVIILKFFELDAPVTQEAKINQLKKRGVEINPNTIFISIDFNKDSIENKLIESGFCKNKKSLFILESLTMYLDTGAIDNTFEVINRFAGDGSEVVFDYVYSSVLREENLYYGESEVYKGVKKKMNHGVLE
jgi:O-Methyltransferase involved in polyketide biosynthesis